MIQIDNIYKSFNGHQVLNGISLNIEKGKTTVIIGRSGCGKSVLLKHVMGILKPDGGKILFDGQDIGKFDEEMLHSLRLKMSMVFQSAALFDSLNVGDNVGFALIEHQRLQKDEIARRVRESLAMVGLSGIERLMPSELSGGMKKRVALARAICIKPDIIIYDEPTTGVDPITADIINELIKELHDRLKVTSIAVTHDMKSAYKIADWIAMLYQGKIIAYGYPDDIRNTDNPVVHQFINGLSTGPITEGE
ncbi:MAG: ABC transporter ATP-binding protein [Candidatus Omnitrophica bacterium]|nr:ABC transporter ATP-binding protein [Candidatus Omnitrophota bacterium]MBU1871842.1 ABC transporter ATP-binding protein [Candidatus Omnitrophota bacterium]